MTSILKPGSPMCSRGSPITRSLNWPPYYRGIGATRWLLPALPDMAASASAVTISHAAEILGEDEVSCGRWLTRWSRQTAASGSMARAQQTIAFTPAGMEYLRDLLAEYKRNRSSPRP